MTQVFLLAGTGIQPESLPTALQLGAVALVAFSSRQSVIVVSAALCALAIFCKLSALWGPSQLRCGCSLETVGMNRTDFDGDPELSACF